jgi:hypothetical protein
MSNEDMQLFHHIFCTLDEIEQSMQHIAVKIQQSITETNTFIKECQK